MGRKSCAGPEKEIPCGGKFRVGASTPFFARAAAVSQALGVGAIPLGGRGT